MTHFNGIRRPFIFGARQKKRPEERNMYGEVIANMDTEEDDMPSELDDLDDYIS